MKRDLSAPAAIAISLAAVLVIGLLGWLLFLRPSGARDLSEVVATVDTPEGSAISEIPRTGPGQPASGQGAVPGDTPTASSDQ